MIENYPKLVEASVISDYNLLLLFSNGEKKIYDFAPNLRHPYFEDLSNQSFFRNFAVNDGEIEWASGQDFCPHTLYEKGVSCTTFSCHDK